ncbi:hypothetical protein OROGR_003339 [Orobanche gracilis]
MGFTPLMLQQKGMHRQRPIICLRRRSASRLFRYPLRSATRTKEEKLPLADSSNSNSATKRGMVPSSVSKSVSVLDLSGKEKNSKPPRRLSVPSKSNGTLAPKSVGTITSISETKAMRSAFSQGKSDTPVSDVPKSFTRKKISTVSSASYWLSQIKLSESAAKHSSLLVAALHEDKKVLERLTKSKEAALLEAERILRSALERVLVVEEVQNHYFELRRQIEICQNKILDKTNRQKVLEVEKLSPIKELEEAVLAGGRATNTIRDYRRQIMELNEGKRTLERELARVKVSANRIATIVANEWKDDKDMVMPVKQKQWLEERRILQVSPKKIS